MLKQKLKAAIRSVTSRLVPEAVIAAVSDPKKNEPGVVWEENGRRFVGLGEGLKMEFVRIPVADFNMGSEYAHPIHKVHLDEYWIGRYPVTNEQYHCFVRQKKYRSPDDWKNGESPVENVTHPVVNVSWNDVMAFCTWLEGQIQRHGNSIKLGLPTEAQWENAASGADGRNYLWGEQKPDARLCNFNMNIGETSPVGQYSPQGDSPFGCADMAGNVGEWCQDWYGPYSATDQCNPTGQPSGDERILRGGSWGDIDDRVVRSNNRDWLNPDSWGDCFGFRCAMSAVPGRA